jgi:hypothetical protein
MTDEQIKVRAETRHLIRLGATMNECTMGAFVDEAVSEFLANHADEIEAGLANAREVLRAAASSTNGG